MNRQEEIKKASMIIANGQVSSENFVKGAEWADKTMIEKACEWLKENLQDYINDDWTSEPDFIKEFKQAMTED